MPISPLQYRVSSQTKTKPPTPTKYNHHQPKPPVDLSPTKPLVNYFTIITVITMVLLPISSCWLAHQPLLPTMGGGGEGWGPPHAGVVGYHTSRPYSITMAHHYSQPTPPSSPPTLRHHLHHPHEDLTRTSDDSTPDGSDSTLAPGDSTQPPSSPHLPLHVPRSSASATNLTGHQEGGNTLYQDSIVQGGYDDSLNEY